jgi:NTP pyrophosphatase (non-canonical NTP hydrolase)
MGLREVKSTLSATLRYASATLFPEVKSYYDRYFDPKKTLNHQVEGSVESYTGLCLSSALVDRSKVVDDLLEILRKFRDERDWGRFHTPKDLAVSVSIEAGELLELFQWRGDGHDIAGINVRHVADEAADVLIYLLLLFDRLDLDPRMEVLNKIARNAERFPIEKSFGVPSAFTKRINRQT